MYILTFSENYYKTIAHNFFRVHIKHYWCFQRVTTKYYYTLFSVFISNNIDIFKNLSPNYTILFRAHIKTYGPFQRVHGMQFCTDLRSKKNPLPLPPPKLEPRPSLIACRITCMQTLLRVHENFCTILIPLCKNNLNLRVSHKDHYTFRK